MPVGPGAGLQQPLELYAEQSGLSGEVLGNFAQAFTHVALISAAYNLDWTFADRTD